jgi:Peptidase of plants and bacteria/WD40-like Beta Propeller Repeat
MKRHRRSFTIALTLIFLSTGAAIRTAEAQYFGQNKVQYQDFTFRILHTPHFDIYYYPEEEPGVKYAARIAERWYARHSIILQDSLHGAQPLILYASFPHFEETNVVQGIGIGTGGVTEPALRRITLPFAGPLEETNHVIGHELVHAFQYDILGREDSGAVAGLSAERLPLWFIEGMAEYFSLGPDDPNTTMWMREATRRQLPDISDLDNPKYFPYRYGQSLLAYIGGRWGDSTIAELLKNVRRARSVSASIDSVLGISTDSLSRDWHAALHAQYDSLATRTSVPTDYGPALISEKNGGELNVSPVVSPDGKHLVFFSTKNMFSIDLYLADARTGKNQRDIYSTALDSHLQNLEFINSAGSWDAAGQQFVFSAVRKGRPILEILNLKSDRIEREIPFRSLGQIFDPAWSPDGRYIAFSAIEGGLSDLFLYDLQTDSLQRLTDDAYADVQPAWSPDGHRLAFVTDRFTTNLDDIDLGNYQLAIMDLPARTISPLPGCKGVKNINPQWSADGKSLYFISDRDGISNIYTLSLNSGTIAQVTNLFGGVSGITSLSPAISVSQKSNDIVYSVFEDGKYAIYSIDSTRELAGTSLVPAVAANQAVLPPVKRSSTRFLSDLGNPELGLPPDTAHYSTTPYITSFHLVGIGQPTIGAGVDPYGTYFGGGVSLLWSDMLGNHNLATALSFQSGTGYFDVAGLLGYFNTAHRWYWGTFAQQTPYIYGSDVSGFAVVDGQDAYVEQQVLYREMDRNLMGTTSYPFSQVLRTEFSLGYRNISFSSQVSTQAVAINTGALLQNDTHDLPAPSAINLGLASGALVYDNSVMGATGPILGARARVELSPSIGTLSLMNILADYRQYVMPIRPITIAGRILHYGRYGGSADDDRLTPLYMAYPGLLRGYDNGLFSSGQYAYYYATGSDAQLNRLYGSKFLVGNLEVRFPLFGLLGLGDGYYGWFPIDMATFFDTGVAWTGADKAWFLGGDRKELSSVGEAARINLFGYFVAEVDYVHPLNLPGTGWVWEFSLSQGF